MKPVMLLIPGMLTDASVWAEVAGALQDAAQVRVLPTPLEASVPDMARTAWAGLADVPAQVPLLLAGFSMGGYIALEMLARPVRAIAGAALVSTMARPESAEAAANRERAIAAMQANFPRAVDGVAQWGTHAASPELLERLRRMMLGIGADTAIRQSRAIMARADHRALLPRLTMPAEVICGRHDRITPPPLSQELADGLPDARLHILEEAGHMVPAEQAAAVAAILKDLAGRACASPTTTHNKGDR